MEIVIVNGIGNERSGFDAPITQQDLAALLARYVEKSGFNLRQTMQNVCSLDGDEICDYTSDAIDLMGRAER